MRKSYFPFCIWVLLYIISGLIADSLNPPGPSLAIVWFPAGVATAAFLRNEYRMWPIYTLAFALSNMLFSDFDYADPAGSLVLAVLTIPVSMVIAWGVHRFARKEDGLHLVSVWLLMTLLASAIDSLLFALGLRILEAMKFSEVFWQGFVSDVTGNIFAVTLILSMLRGPYRTRRFSFKDLPVTLLLSALVTLTSVLIFSLDPDNLALGEPSAGALAFLLTCLPVLLCAITAVAAGSQGGGLALLLLASVTIFFTRQGLGPFFSEGLRTREPLILLQIYLTGAAILLLFTRVLTETLAKNKLSSEPVTSSTLVYRLDICRNTFMWSWPDRELPFQIHEEMTMQEILQQVHPNDRERLTAHWNISSSESASVTFRVRSTEGEWVEIQDLRRQCLKGSVTEFILGEWVVVQDNQE